MVDRGGPLDQAFFAGDGAGIFGTDVVEALLIEYCKTVFVSSLCFFQYRVGRS